MVDEPHTEERHTRLVRITHWINAVAFVFMLASGIGILLAFPALHWGEAGYPGGPEPWLSFGIEANFNHTAWGRNIHFLFAWVLVINGLVYLLSGLVGGHFKKKLVPRKDQLRPAHLLADIQHHLQFKAVVGQDYNVLQKLAYLIVVFLLFPVLFLTGLTMSPGITAAFPELFSLFGGRQSARTIHFLCASGLLLFLIVHVWQVFLAGAKNEIKAMITGKQLPVEDKTNDI